MSEQAPEATPLVDAPPSPGDSLFASVMGAFMPPSDAEATPEGGAEAPPAADASGQPQPPAQGTEPAPADAETPPAGDDGKPPVQGEQPPTGESTSADTGGDEQTAGKGELDAKTLAPRWTEMSTALEERTLKTHQSAAYKAVREEYGQYFEAVEKHPRLLIGQRVNAVNENEPGVDSDGKITLRDSDDAKEWQEAVKNVLSQEMNSRANTAMQGSNDELQTLHQSIEVFQNNADLIPGTKQFDKELADRFAATASAYAVKSETGKIVGYGIKVQPLIDQIRTTLTAERAAKPAAPAAPAKPAAPAAAPQAGIQSKAGAGAEPNTDIQDLFGTLGNQWRNIRL